MANIWIHRKCARPESEDYAGDELILPKQRDETGMQICEVCRMYKPTYGNVYLHKGDEVNWTAPKPEVAESTPTEVPDLVLPEKVAEVVAEEIAEATEEIVIEEAVDAEPEPSVTIAVEVDAEKAKAKLDKLEAQIAKLQAKKEALEK